MLKVDTFTAQSEIHGKGLFAAEFIPKGTIIWKFDPEFDKVISESEFLSLEGNERDHWEIYSFRFNNEFYLCGDDGIYFNHKETDYNCDEDPVNNTTIANRDIQKGEELTTNYENFGITKEDRLFNYIGL